MEAVGSIRRQVEYVGDVDLIAPLPDFQGKRPTFATDPLFVAVNKTMTNALQDPDPAAGGLFGGDPAPQTTIVGEAIEGLKPGFKAASLRVICPNGLRIPVQIFRYTPESYGWIKLMRTGPSEFSQAFLSAWKRVHGINNGQGSIEGHLVDVTGKVVPVCDEAAAFRMVGWPFIEPIDRTNYVERTRAARRDALRD